MHSVLFRIGSLTVYGYGASIAVGMVAAMLLLYFRAKKMGYDPDLFFNGALLGIVAGVLGAKLLYIITDLPAIIADPSILLDIGGGFVVYGGLVTGLLAPLIYLRVKKTTVLEKFDLAMPSIAIGQAFGRIGCFLAGCCYGKACPAGAWYGMHFPEGSDAPSGVAIYPTQAMSAVFDFLLFAFLWFFVKKEKFRGETVCLYMLLYSVGRFLIEYLRDDPRGSVGPFSTSQFISLFIFAGGIILFFVFRKKGLPGPPVLDEVSKAKPKKKKAEGEER